MTQWMICNSNIEERENVPDNFSCHPRKIASESEPCDFVRSGILASLRLESASELFSAACCGELQLFNWFGKDKSK